MDFSPVHDNILLLALNKQKPQNPLSPACGVFTACVHHVTFRLYQEKDPQVSRGQLLISNYCTISIFYLRHRKIQGQTKRDLLITKCWQKGWRSPKVTQLTKLIT